MVAQAAGVSTAVVSEVLNPHASGAIRVSKGTAERVRETVQQLGYAPNLIAQSLAKGRRNILGVFTYESVFPSDRGNFFYPMLRGIEMQVAGAGYDLLLFTSAQDEARSRKIYTRGSNRLGVADGAILLGQEPDSKELERLATEGFQFVTVGRRNSATVELNWVAAGYSQATAEIVDYGHQRGHRKIAFLGSGTIREQQIDREIGFVSSIGRFGLEDHPEWRHHRDSSSLDKAWLSKLLDDGVTLVLAETLEHAQTLERFLQEDGLTVPADLSIAVLGSPLEDTDDIERWTRFRIPREEMGREAVRLLLGKLGGQIEGPAQQTISCTFVVGTTIRQLNNDT